MFKSIVSITLSAFFIIGAAIGSKYLFANRFKRGTASENYLHNFLPRPAMISRVTEATQRWPFYTDGVPKNPEYPCGTAVECSRKSRRRTETLNLALQHFQKDFTKVNATNETLADLNNFFIAHWCERSVFHSVCGTDPYHRSKIFKLTSYNENNKGARSVFQPEDGATGVLLLTADGQYVRIYFNARAQGKQYGDGNTGVIYQYGQGLNSIQNVSIGLRGSVYRDGEVITNDRLGQLYIHWSDTDSNAHIFWWEHHKISYSDGLLRIAMQRDGFEEKWEEVLFDDLNPLGQRAISHAGPGFETLW